MSLAMITVNVNGRLVGTGGPIQGGSMYDNEIQTFEFVGLPTFDADQTVSLQWIDNVEGRYGSSDTLTKTTNGYSYTVGSDMSNCSSVVAYIRITNGDEVWNSKEFYISLNKLPDITQAYYGIPGTNVIQQALDILNQGIGDISGATQLAEDAADNANDAASDANDAASSANTVADSANAAAIRANNAITNVIAPEFSSSVSYNAGQYVAHEGEFYKFITAHAAGAWTGTDVEQTKVSIELVEILNDIGDLVYVPVSFTTFSASPNQAEKGSTVSSVTLTYALNKVPTTLSVGGVAIIPPVQSGTRSITGASYTTNQTWSASATDSGSPSHSPSSVSRSVTLFFLSKAYYGAATAPETINSAFLLGLANGVLTSTRARTFTVNAESNQYIWYAVPSSFGACSFSVGGFDGGFTKVSTFSHTNASGGTENYDVYRSDNASLGSTTVIVS